MRAKVTSRPSSSSDSKSGEAHRAARDRHPDRLEHDLGLHPELLGQSAQRCLDRVVLERTGPPRAPIVRRREQPGDPLGGKGLLGRGGVDLDVVREQEADHRDDLVHALDALGHE